MCNGWGGKRTNGCWTRFDLFDVEKEEDEVLWPHRPKKNSAKTDTLEGRRQAAKGQTCKDLFPGFKRLDKAGHCGCIPTGDRSRMMA